jgi:ABC-type oligopeptide transport system ATPase subunit
MEIFILAGENGCGKTISARIFLGIPDNEYVQIRGYDGYFQ